MSIDVDPCPRCAGRHERVGFTPFTNAESATFQFWAMCPVKGEPILVRWRDAAAEAARIVEGRPS